MHERTIHTQHNSNLLSKTVNMLKCYFTDPIDYFREFIPLLITLRLHWIMCTRPLGQLDKIWSFVKQTLVSEKKKT